MSYNRPDASQLVAPSLKLPASGAAGSMSLLSNASLATDLSLYLPSSYGTSGHAMITDGSGNLSWVDLVDAFTNDVLIATDAVASNGNTTMGLQAGLRQKLFGNGNYSVKSNDNNLMVFDAAAQTFDFGSTTYYTKSTYYTLTNQMVLAPAASTNAWKITDASSGNYLNLDVTSGSENFTLGNTSRPVKTTNYGDLSALSAANTKPPRIGIGAGAEVLRVGGNLRSLPTVPPPFTITQGADTVLLSETVNANFLNDAGTQIRVKFALRDATASGNTFKLSLKFGGTLMVEGPTFTATVGGYTVGEFVMLIATNGANPTRNVTANLVAHRQTNTLATSVSRNFASPIDFTVQASLQLVLTGVSGNNDTQELEQASMDVVLPETASS